MHSILKNFVKFSILGGFILLTHNAWAISSNDSKNEYKVSSQYTLDVYRTHQVKIEDIKSKIHKKIEEMASILSSPESFSSSANVEKLLQLTAEAEKDIHTMGHFAFVNISFNIYAGDKTIPFTVNLVDKEDQFRLSHFLPKPKQDTPDPNNLIEDYLAYQKTADEIMTKEKKALPIGDCPFRTCHYGFEHESLKKYKTIFNQVSQNKEALMATLQNDKNPRKREAATNLLVNLPDGEEVIKALTPSIFDSDSGVRNNSMIFIQSVLFHQKSTHFPIEKVVTALDFPMRNDRQKALLVIKELVDNPVYADYVKKNARYLVVEELKMQQSYLHEPAYEILKKISDQSFGDRDYASWEQWAKSVS